MTRIFSWSWITFMRSGPPVGVRWRAKAIMKVASFVFSRKPRENYRCAASMKPAVRFMKSGSGTYVLILKSDSEGAVRIGRWGIMDVEPGYYIYVGSALGPGGVRSRVTRHWRSDKAKHWHIDYLREVLVMWNAWFTYSEERLEHRWANLLLHMEGMNCVPGFGCSDCKCDSHLFQTAALPDMASFSRAIGTRLHEMRRTAPRGVRGS